MYYVVVTASIYLLVDQNMDSPKSIFHGFSYLKVLLVIYPSKSNTIFEKSEVTMFNYINYISYYKPLKKPSLAEC